MDMSNNINDLRRIEGLPTRHRLLYADVASGLSLTLAAKQRGYSVAHSCRLVRSEPGRHAVAIMRTKIEALLAAELPELIEQAVDVLRRQLNSPCPDRRVRAAEFILKNVAGVLVEPVALNANDAATGSIVGNIVPIMDSKASENGGSVIEYVPIAPDGETN